MNENYTNAINQQSPWGAGAGYNTGFNNGQGFPGQAIPKMKNPLTPEELQLLRNGNAFTLQVSPEEVAQAVCTHKHPENGRFATVDNGDGTVTCSICHTTFAPDLVDENYAKDSVQRFINTLETCKLIGLDINEDVIRGLFQMEPFVKKIPDLFKMAQSSFFRYNEFNPNANVGNPSSFGMFNQLMNPAMPINGYAPYMQQMQQPQQQGYAGYNPAPAQTPYMQQQASMVGGNPFYVQPQMQPQPQQMQQPMNNVQVPGQQQPQSANSAKETGTGQVEVNAQMSL